MPRLAWLLATFVLVGGRAILAGQANSSTPSRSGDGEYHDLNNDNRIVSIQLFNWKWTDIARECAFLGQNGFAAVQVSPPQEHILLRQGSDQPWWVHYQPVSYLMTSRMGSDEEFQTMVSTCESHGVFIIIDAVINHMTGSSAGAGTGSSGSPYDASTQSFPGVPFTTASFHTCGAGRDCETNNCEIQDFDNQHEAEQCRLVGLLDLFTQSSDVRDKIASYFNKLLAWGVRGFRVDAVGHIHPGDMSAIAAQLDDTVDGHRPFIVGETTRSDEDRYGSSGRVTDFRCAHLINHAIEHDASLLLGVGGDECVSDANSFWFITNHDKERDPRYPGSEHCEYRASFHCQDAGAVWRYRLAAGFLLTYPHGLPRVMSGYYFADHDEGPPHHGEPDLDIKDATDAGGNCLTENGWDCRHRLPDVYRLVDMRTVTAAEAALLHGTGHNHMQLHYSLGSLGFVAINAANHIVNPGDEDWIQTVPTALPPGVYCSVVVARLSADTMTCEPLADIAPRKEVLSYTVSATRHVDLRIEADDYAQVLGLHTGQRVGTSMATGVFFQVNGAPTTPGQRIIIVGNHSSLGNWDCANGIDLVTDSEVTGSPFKYPDWAGLVFLEPGLQLEWTAIRTTDCSDVEWSAGDDSSLLTGRVGEQLASARPF